MQNRSMNLTPNYIINIVLRRRWYIIIPFCLSMLAGIFYTVQAPKIYEASTLILIEPQRVPESYVQSIVTTDPSARIATISEQVNSRTNINRIIEKFGLLSGPQYSNMFTEDKIGIIRNRILVDVTRSRSRRGNEFSSFSISYRGKNPENTMDIANTLASLLIDENLRTRESQAVGTSEFLNEELNTMRSKLVEVEGRLEAFRTQYMGELPEQLDSNLAILERLQVELSDRMKSVREEKNRLSVLEQLIAAPAIVTQITQNHGQTSQPAIGESSDPNVLRHQLSNLLAKYTDKHPDVIAVKKKIIELENRTVVSSSSGEEDAQSETMVSSLNIRNENIRQKQEVKLAINLLKKEIRKLRNQIIFYQNRVEVTPEREQELASLQRDYENIQTAYNSLLERKLEADIAVNMERQQKGEQFQILDAASLPQRPISPDMQKLFLLFLAAGFGIGGVIIFVLEYLDTSLKGPEDIESLGVGMLATIPNIRSRKDILLKNINHILSALSVFISLTLFSGFLLLVIKGEETVMNLINKLILI